MSSILQGDARDPRLSRVQLLSAELSLDGSCLRVGFALVGAPGSPEGAVRAAEQALQRAAPFFRASLASALDLKRLPRLKFIGLGQVAPGDAPAGSEGGDPWSGS